MAVAIVAVVLGSFGFVAATASGVSMKSLAGFQVESGVAGCAVVQPMSHAYLYCSASSGDGFHLSPNMGYVTVPETKLVNPAPWGSDAKKSSGSTWTFTAPPDWGAALLRWECEIAPSSISCRQFWRPGPKEFVEGPGVITFEPNVNSTPAATGPPERDIAWLAIAEPRAGRGSGINSDAFVIIRNVWRIFESGGARVRLQVRTQCTLPIGGDGSLGFAVRKGWLSERECRRAVGLMSRYRRATLDWGQNGCGSGSAGFLQAMQDAGLASDRLRFRRECMRHDFCYRNAERYNLHALNGGDNPKNECDTALRREMMARCEGGLSCKAKVGLFWGILRSGMGSDITMADGTVY